MDLKKQLQLLNSKTADAWILQNQRLKKEFVFSDFNAALQFMLKVGKSAESLNHHPEWCNIYNKVAIELTTHSAAAITQLDFDLAHKIEQEFKSAKSK
ncbi:MAG: hypothetical protein FXV79_00960 [Candidatus Thioglobus sp.]|nr:MAG: hypothetical protein FXV79_00960 [Candidatus Thioglobus sp.]